MRQFAALLTIQIRSFLRDRASMFWTFFLPVFLLVLFGTAFSSGQVRRSKVVVCDQDMSFWSNKIVNGLRESGLVDVSISDTTSSDAELVIPEAFSDDVGNGKPRQVRVIDHTGRIEQIGPVLGALTGVLATLNLDAVGSDALMSFAFDEAPQDTGRVSLYIDFLLSGLIGLNVMSMTLFGIGLGFSSARASGFLRRLWLTPTRPEAYVAAQVAFTTIVVTVAAVLLASVALCVFSTALPCSPGRYIFVLILGILAFAPIALAIASKTRHPQTTSSVINLVYFPLMFLSGTYFSVGDLPTPIPEVMSCLPLKPFLDALRAVAIGTPISEIYHLLAVLVLWAVVGVFAAGRVMQWKE